MSDIGYRMQLEGGVYGTPDNPQSPEDITAQQEAAAAAQAALTTAPGYVPPGLGYGANAPEWASQPGGPANLPVIGWTVQNAGNRPAFGPYDSSHIGHIPDWTGDGGGTYSGNGPYDMNQVVAVDAPNPLNRGPIGDAYFGAIEGSEPPNPNSIPMDNQSLVEDLEW